MRQSANIYFTADYHIGHDNILKFCPNRGETLEDMENTIIKRFNSTVPTNATVYFLGDMGKNTNNRLKEFMDKLICRTKILIVGNHDQKSYTALYNSGFDVVLNSASLHVAKRLLTLSHYPLKATKRETIGDEPYWYGEARKNVSKLALTNEGQYHLHGHIHSPNGGKSVTKLPNQWDVGIDGNNMTPVSIQKVTDWLLAEHSTKKI